MRWAVLNSVALLRTHERAHDALAAAMQRGESVRVLAPCWVLHAFNACRAGDELSNAWQRGMLTCVHQ